LATALVGSSGVGAPSRESPPDFHRSPANPLATGPGGRQYEAIRRFHSLGYYLASWDFPLRYMQGFVMINLFTTSVLICVMALLAWLYRQCDDLRFREYLGLIEWQYDLNAAFIPTILILIVWAVAAVLCTCLDKLLRGKAAAFGEKGLARALLDGILLFVISACVYFLASMIASGIVNLINPELPHKLSWIGVGAGVCVVWLALFAAYQHWLRTTRDLIPGVRRQELRDWLRLTNRVFFYLFIASLPLGIVLLFSNGTISLASSSGFAGKSGEVKIDSNMWTTIIFPILIALVPLVRPDRLIRSAERPTQAWQSGLVRLTVSAAILGVPLIIFGFLANENVSRFADRRAPEFLVEDIRDWPRFEKWLASDEFRLLLQLPPPSGSQADPYAIQLAELESSTRSQDWIKDKRASYNQLIEGIPFLDHRNTKPSHPLLEAEATWARWNLFRDLAIVVGEMCNPAVGSYREFASVWDRERSLRQEIVGFLNRDLLQSDSLIEALEPIARSRMPAQDSTLTARVDAKDDALDKLIEARIAAGMSEGDTLKDAYAAAQVSGTPKTPLDKRVLNRLLLDAVFPEHFNERASILRVLLVENDQWTRGACFFIFLAVALVSGGILDLNRASLHWFYREKLQDAFLPRLSETRVLERYGKLASKAGESPAVTPPSVSPRAAEEELRLSEMRGYEIGAPYPLIVTTRRFVGRSNTPHRGGRGPFLLSPLFVGSTEREPRFDPTRSTDTSRLTAGSAEQDPRAMLSSYVEAEPSLVPTSHYMGGNLDLASAIAISGGAVSPVGTSNPFLLTLMLFLNLRLGQWLPNPTRRRFGKPRRRDQSDRFLANSLLGEVAASVCRNAEDRRYCLLTDGGHYENLGIEPLLDRRSDLILALDATEDPQYDFEDLARVFRRARVDDGIRIERLVLPERRQAAAGDDQTDVDRVMLDQLRPKESYRTAGFFRFFETRTDQPIDLPNDWFSDQHFLVAKIKYPKLTLFDRSSRKVIDEPAKDGYLVYFKSTLTGDEPLDLIKFKEIEPIFPHHPTSIQFYDQMRVESYRQLGEHMMDSFLASGTVPEADEGEGSPAIRNKYGIDWAEREEAAPGESINELLFKRIDKYFRKWRIAKK
jgi:hypothetical protein